MINEVAYVVALRLKCMVISRLFSQTYVCHERRRNPRLLKLNYICDLNNVKFENTNRLIISLLDIVDLSVHHDRKDMRLVPSTVVCRQYVSSASFLIHVTSKPPAYHLSNSNFYSCNEVARLSFCANQ